jgi:hypothetical protein
MQNKSFISNSLLKKCKQLKKQFKEPKEYQKKITLLKNLIVSIIYFICYCIVSRDNLIKGLIIFYLNYLFIAYINHYVFHKYKCIFTIIHHYHHSFYNFFSIFLQIALECVVYIGGYIPAYYFTDTKYFDVWAVIHNLLVYTTVHNINYGYFHVNNFHKLHHENQLTNYGPDFCDILFGTKNQSAPEIENITYYIPNTIIVTIIILFLQYICLNKKYEEFLKNTLINIEILLILICVISSIYLYYYYPDVLK